MTPPRPVEPRTQVRGSLALAVLLVLPGCITERAPSARTHTAAEGSAARQAPIATPATHARSRNAASKVAIQPLGLVPYDGSTLPLVSPDGSRLATQVGLGTLDQPMCIEIYDLSRTPITSVRSSPDDPVALAYSTDDEGFFVHRIGERGARVNAKVLMDGSVADAEHPSPDPRVSERAPDGSPEAMRAAALASISRSASGASVFFDLRTSRVAAWFPDEPAPVLLASGSIAGCWNGDDSVLVTTNEGLFLQRLTQDHSGWRAGDPVRLLREPYVPRATTNPERPWILIGPGPKENPDMLQILAMRLIEE